MVGGGGGGGGTSAVTGYQGGAGGGAAYVEVFATITPGAGNTATYTVGANGVGGAVSAAGTTGGSTSFHVYTAAGGTGGVVGTSSTAKYTLGGAAPSLGHIKVAGSYGASNGTATFGGDSPLGTGGFQINTGTNGLAGTGYGAGGTSAINNASAGKTGGNGSPGVIIVEEYF